MILFGWYEPRWRSSYGHETQFVCFAVDPLQSATTDCTARDYSRLQLLCEMILEGQTLFGLRWG